MENPSPPKAGSAGFTLVELAVCLCIIGILSSGAMLGVSQYLKVNKVRETHRRIDFVMNALSAYAQTHYRLPCPADPRAASAQAGRELDDGKCFVSNNAALHQEAEGIVPWKELAIPQNMAVDSWGRYITYKPAPALTQDTVAQAARTTPGSGSTDIHNACRTALWYDPEGNHINRAKALFCCNDAGPQDNDHSAAQQVAQDDSSRNWSVVDAETAASIEPAAGGSLPDAAPVKLSNSWTDRGQDPNFNGSFSIPRYMDGPAAPLLRATGLAVVLISHGNGGSLDKGADSGKKNAWPPQMFAAVLANPMNRGGPGSEIVSWLRSDQLFARVGSGSCENPATSAVQSYSCRPQSFRTGSTSQTITDPATGKKLPAPPLYALQAGLRGNRYQLRASLTKSGDNGNNDDSLGFYEVGSQGRIQNVQMLVPDVRGWTKDETRDINVTLDANVMGIGLFIVPDGYRAMDGYKHTDLSLLKFVSGFAQFNEKEASITDQSPPMLVSVDPVTGFESRITGAGDVSAYHLYSNLNPGRASHTLSTDAICHVPGERVGANGDIICARASALDRAGVDAASAGFALIGFSDSSRINCYEMKDGSCGSGSDARAVREDGEGGYLASLGDNSYDDVAFSIGLSACPQGM